MKAIFIALLCCLLMTKFASSQNKVKLGIANVNAVIQKWTKACLNLEGKPNLFGSKKWIEMYSKSVNHELDKKESWRIQDSTYHKRYTGTGIYFLYQNKHYIVTARHVLEDTSSIYMDVFEFIYLIENGSEVAKGKSIDPFRFYLN